MTKYVIDAEAKEITKPNKVQVNGAWVLSPSDEDLALAGIFPIDETKPEKVGVYFIPRGIEKRDGVWHRVYEEQPIVAPPPPVTRYSKLKLIVAAKAAGKWAAFKQFIASAGYEDEWAACQFLSSDYAQFAAAKEAIIAAGIATADEVEAILAASVDEEV